LSLVFALFNKLIVPIIAFLATSLLFDFNLIASINNAGILALTKSPKTPDLRPY